MKKMLLAFAVLAMAGMSRAESIFITPANPDPFSVIGGQFQGALITHVQAVDQVTTQGNKIALRDSVILIGKLKNDFLCHVNVGYSATRNSDGTYSTRGFQGGLFFPLNNILQSLGIKAAPQYEFLNGLQWGPSIGHDWSDTDRQHVLINHIGIDVGWQYGPEGK